MLNKLHIYNLFVRAEWNHKLQLSQPTQLITVLLPELIWQLVEEQAFWKNKHSSLLLPSLELFWGLGSISLILRCFAFLWRFFFGVLAVAISRLLCPSFNLRRFSVAWLLNVELQMEHLTFECWFLVTGGQGENWRH